MTYPNDPIQARFERDVHFRSLVSMLEATLHAHQFSPSELRDACLLAATRYEMRAYPQKLVYSEGEVHEFLRRTERNEAGEKAIADREHANDPYLASIAAGLRRTE